MTYPSSTPFLPSLLAAGALAALTSCLMASANTQEDGAPPEFGSVDWGRKLELALEEARAAKKPVMLLFQEVPG